MEEMAEDRVSAKLRPPIPGLGMMMDCLRTCTLLVFMTDVDAVDILSQCRHCSCPYPGPPCKVRTLVARGRPNVGAVAAPVGPQLSQQLVLGAQQHRRQLCQLSTPCQDC